MKIYWGWFKKDKQFNTSTLYFVFTQPQQRGCVIGNTEIDKRGNSPVFDIDRWNFQQLLNLENSETSQNLRWYKQLLLSSFNRKKSKSGVSLYFLLHIPFWMKMIVILWICKALLWHSLSLRDRKVASSNLSS